MGICQEEKELVKRIVKRDEKALFNFYKKYRLPIFNFVKSQINDSASAEELTQDIFLDFIEALRDFRFQSSLKTYLFAIAKHKVIDVIRKKKVEKILFSHFPSYVVESLKTVFIDEEINRKELRKKIKKSFDFLPNDYQLILRLKYIDGVKVSEIAQKLKMKFKTVESLLFRARRAFVKVFNNLP